LKELYRLEKALNLQDVALFRYLTARSHLSHLVKNSAYAPHMRLNLKIESVSIVFHLSKGNVESVDQCICTAILDQAVAVMDYYADSADLSFTSKIQTINIADECLPENGFPLLLLDLILTGTTAASFVNGDPCAAALVVHLTLTPFFAHIYGLDILVGLAHILYDRPRVELIHHFFKGEDKYTSLLRTMTSNKAHLF
jgi:hypothetical protein